eukprot:gb/GECG01002991.1/.p1 GENE.gb/GECG01002991.1/~~gb/GECG01002991.1/.p1  ORF type:complete len:621 (+),score=89.12 gb/GECG01002991.1/:1-1863(+)
MLGSSMRMIRRTASKAAYNSSRRSTARVRKSSVCGVQEGFRLINATRGAARFPVAIGGTLASCRLSTSTGTGNGPQPQGDEFPRWRSPLKWLSSDAEVDAKVYIVNRETILPSLASSQDPQEDTSLDEEEEDGLQNIDTSSLPWPYSKLGAGASLLQKPSGGMAAIGTDGTQQQHIVYSIGSNGKVTAENFHKAGYSIRKELQRLKACNVELVFDLAEDSSESSQQSSNTDIFLHSFQGANYSFSRHLTRKAKRPKTVEGIRCTTGPSGSEEANMGYVNSCCEFFEDNFRRSITDSMYLARDLSNEREEEVNCQTFEDRINDLVKMHGDKFTMEVIRGNKLREKELNMIYAVGQAGRYEPRLIELKYIGDPSRPEEIDAAIVGKGIVFDSGGLNLKPTGNIENMHMDMGGAAAALGAAHGTALQNLKRNVVFSFPLAENCVDSIAYKPHAILKSAKGLTVEVGNTDAEGRLVMADAFTHVQSTHHPKQLIDIATLTGACVIALGEEAGGIFSNNDDLCQRLLASGSYVREPLWRLPILEGHRDSIRTGSSHADLMSTGSRGGGASTAAAFLEQFVSQQVPWAHLDIAGAGMLSKEKGHLPKGGSGYGAALLTHYLREVKS